MSLFQIFILKNVKGQMTVELALLFPVLLVLACICISCIQFIYACTYFDQMALDEIISQGVSPSGSGGDDAVVREIQEALNYSFSNFKRVNIEVRQTTLGEKATDEILSFLTGYKKIECTLNYVPWPLSAHMSFMGVHAPIKLSHTRSLVIDTYKGGVVI